MDNNGNEEVVSKNFIEQIIEKDLAEGHCKVVKTRFLRSRMVIFISDMPSQYY